jgi:hypothetical protein
MSFILLRFDDKSLGVDLTDLVSNQHGRQLAIKMGTVHGEVMRLENIGSISSVNRILINFVGCILIHLNQHF